MNTAMTRLATEADISRLCSLYWEFHLYHVLGMPDRLRMPDDASDNANEANKLETGLRAIIEREDAAIFVTEVEGKVVGLVEVYLRQDENQLLAVAHRYGYIQSLSVFAPYRKLGCGTALMQVAHKWAKQREATEMQLNTWEFAEGPLLFYEKLGYRTLQRHMVAPLRS